ncbi:chemotaxis response regulator protein-glutamate methylesterase [Synoicihabitans lomoniglobus]|uniref:Protein-glutamate methylesterase/protein-glutamine glutaminase n=1 Tax=Synoicihabitans lomoniglobus TaxID=2909285 RepID=A0AAF0I4D0_9BACT|nr:chemotaxis response regulator protein-glutamate methylesterase [Opitutaceae bacterium LMO-M01]WED66704.1 chemotaxis response regulator protein-glutamate methylesterase [Opitutaceae bacterium LMO-M01]
MRIGIVNDMALTVEVLKRVLALNPRHHIAWVARTGQEAVEKCAQDTPELVLMDLIMPQLDGVEATRRIMANSPCAILVVTVSVGKNAWKAFEAMGHGALDAVDTPTFGSGDWRTNAAPLLAKIEIIGKMVKDRNGRLTPPLQAPRGINTSGNQHVRLLAIGASAGGPAAVNQILAGLPCDFPAAVVVVQHVDERFAQGMADWLGQESRLPVRVAREGDEPAMGTVLLGGTNDHLVVGADGRLHYKRQPVEYVYRPSVDVFYQSLSLHWKGPVVGVLLTGMGRDGALGLKALRNQGQHTITQDEASSAVYGMPKAAAKLAAAVEILSLERIPSRLTQIWRAG